jgi:molybdate/tungstate transport system substrate-binding protein
MVIAYTNQSRYADQITADNWQEILTRPDVRVGFSNPMLDAAGYRTIMVTLLASAYYKNATIFPAIIGSHFSEPLVVRRSGGMQVVELPEIMRPSDTKLVIRDGSIYVLSLLESGGIDYAFEYRSVAQGHGLHSVDLPEEIDLSAPDHAADYGNVSVILGFQRFSAIGKERRGQPIVYAIAVPNAAPHPELAREFSDMVLAMTQQGGRAWPAPL